MEESLSQLELQLTSETERGKREFERQLQEELSLRLKQMQNDSREALASWEVEQRQNWNRNCLITEKQPSRRY